MRVIYDVIISGGGPTGTLLGYFLSQNGIKTLIIEKEIFPRFKICAGGIQHRILGLIPFGIDPVIENIISGIYFSFRNKDTFLKKNEDPFIYTIDRRRFDSFLAKKAEKAGCEIRFGEKTTGYNSCKNYIEVTTSKTGYRAKILVGADGTSGLVHRRLLKGKDIKKILGYLAELPYKKNINNTESSSNDKGSKFVITDRNNNMYDLHDSVRLDFNGVKKGYCWVFPKRDFFSSGIGAPSNYAISTKKYFKFFLSEFYTSNGCSNNSIHIFSQGIPLRSENTPVKDHRIIAVGDAACLADSFTGEGLYNGFKSSIIAGDSIKEALKKSSFSFDDYEEKIKNNIYGDIKLSIMLKRIFYSSALFFYKLIKKNDNYFYACCRLLRGERTYRDVFRRLESFNIVK